MTDTPKPTGKAIRTKAGRDVSFYLVRINRKGQREVSAIHRVTASRMHGVLELSEVVPDDVGMAVAFSTETVTKALLGRSRSRLRYEVTLDPQLV